MKMILTKKVYKLPTCLLQWYGWSDGLIRWFINGQNRYFLVANVPRRTKVRFAVSTLTKEALFWWNSFTQSIGIEEDYKITLSEFKRLLIEKYCPQTEIRKMEEAITMNQKLIKHVNKARVVMSYASFAVTYTSVYTNSELGRVFWGANEEISNGGSPRVIVYGYDGLPMQPVAPPSPDYIPGPEDPQTPPVPQDEDEREAMFMQPHDPDYVPEPIYPEYIPLEDEHVFLVEEQSLPPRSMRIDDEDEDEGDEDDEEEEEHLALADSAVVVPTVELISPPERTEPASISLPPEAEVERPLAMPTPPPSPPISLLPPSAKECLARCTAPPALSSPPPALVDAVIAALPSPPLPPSLYIPPPVDRRDDIPESEQPPRNRLCLSTLGSRYEAGESSTARPIKGRGTDYEFISTMDAEARQQGISEFGYGVWDTWVDSVEAIPEVAPMTVGEVNTRVTELAELHEHDTQDLYALLEDAQNDTGTSDIATVAWYSYSDTAPEILRVMRDMRREMGDMPTKLLALPGQQIARQPGPDARILDHQDASGDADSHI
ncbi:hypothetical protein Tco_0072703 [Tanacetum coccineum]